jgi:hypothetical protein
MRDAIDVDGHKGGPALVRVWRVDQPVEGLVKLCATTHKGSLRAVLSLVKI